MNRRSFMATLLAAGAAPAIVRAESIMRINPKIIVPENVMLTVWGAGVEYRVRFSVDAAVKLGDQQWERREGGGVWVPTRGVTGPLCTIHRT